MGRSFREEMVHGGFDAESDEALLDCGNIGSRVRVFVADTGRNDDWD
jgi:hypothetical protein